MTNWMTWLVLAGILVILEIFSGTFYLLMIAIGLAAGGLLAWFGVGDSAQVVAAAVVALVATFLLRKSKYGKMQQKDDAARDPNVNMDIGQVVNVDEWKNELRRSRKGRKRPAVATISEDGAVQILMFFHCSFFGAFVPNNLFTDI